MGGFYAPFYKIIAQCEICKHQSHIRYEKYILNKKNHNYYSCKKCRNIKSKLSKKERYGDENYCNKEKIKTTLQSRYGADSPMQIKKFKEKQKQKMEQLGLRPLPKERTDWKNYRIEVNNTTYKNKKKLFKKWNGYDYYDKEYIKENLKNFSCTHAKYPTIDHKNSIFHGFKNNISPQIIGDIKNLCITKKTNNSNKNSKTEKEFISYLSASSNPQDNVDVPGMF